MENRPKDRLLEYAEKPYITFLLTSMLLAWLNYGVVIVGHPIAVESGEVGWWVFWSGVMLLIDYKFARLMFSNGKRS